MKNGDKFTGEIKLLQFGEFTTALVVWSQANRGSSCWLVV
jgi:hypothetical protein